MSPEPDASPPEAQRLPVAHGDHQLLHHRMRRRMRSLRRRRPQRRLYPFKNDPDSDRPPEGDLRLACFYFQLVGDFLGAHDACVVTPPLDPADLIRVHPLLS